MGGSLEGHIEGKKDSGMMPPVSGIGGGCLRHHHAHTPARLRNSLSECGWSFEHAHGWAVGEWEGRASCREGWQLRASTVSDERDAEGGIGGGGGGEGVRWFCGACHAAWLG